MTVLYPRWTFATLVYPSLPSKGQRCSRKLVGFNAASFTSSSFKSFVCSVHFARCSGLEGTSPYIFHLSKISWKRRLYLFGGWSSVGAVKSDSGLKLPFIWPCRKGFATNGISSQSSTHLNTGKSTDARWEDRLSLLHRWLSWQLLQCLSRMFQFYWCTHLWVSFYISGLLDWVQFSFGNNRIIILNTKLFW